MSDNDFVDVKELCPGIIVDPMYSRVDNIFKEVLYPVEACFIRRGMGKKLLEVQNELEKLSLGLIVYDGYRPLSVQKKLWKQCPDDRYVANPDIGSKHNRGAAVDVSLISLDGDLLEMPSVVDDLSERAHRDNDNFPQKVIANRQLLEDIMVSKGFIPLPTEWWHFDDSDWEKYPIEDVCLSELVKSHS